MTASWNGAVQLAEADAKPGHYYVTVKDERGRTSLALGPFTQRKPGKEAHAQALGRVRAVRKLVEKVDWRGAPWYAYGTSRLDLCGSPPVGKLNDRMKGER